MDAPVAGYERRVSMIAPADPRARATGRTLTVLLGEPGDGIRAYAERIFASGRVPDDHAVLITPDDTLPTVAPGDVVHVHVTDRLVERHPRRWEWVTAAARSVAVVMTVHDVPQMEEGLARFDRRVATLRAIVEPADLVVTNSESERRTLHEIGIDARVVPHPIFPVPPVTAGPRLRSLTVVGFIHPGKGVIDLLDAVGHVAGTVLEGWHLRLVGAVAAGHDAHLDAIRHAAEGIGLPTVHTGAVDDRRWAWELTHAGVAICPHLHMSASGSLLSWIAAGRRPVTSATPFVRELAAERRGALHLVHRRADWAPAIHSAVVGRDPDPFEDPTWRTPSSAALVLDELLQEVRRSTERRTA